MLDLNLIKQIVLFFKPSKIKETASVTSVEKNHYN